MKMNKITAGFAVLLLSLTSAAWATTVDFESTPLGTTSNLNFADFTITAQDGRSFDVVSASPGAPVSGHSLITWFQQESQTKLIVTFSVDNVNSFSIGAGDFDQDEDNTFLEVFDSAWNLIGSDSFVNPYWKNGGDYLSVSTSEAIKYAVFWDGEPFPGAIYWDNLSYTQGGGNRVPDTASSALLLALGLASLGLSRRKLAK